jgi:hypothetical protein
MDRFEWERLIRELDLPPSVKNTAAWLATYVNAKDGTRGHPGRVKLSRATGLHPSTVTAALAALEAVGLIARDNHGGGRDKKGVAAVYGLSTPEGETTPDETSRAVRQVFARKKSHRATSNAPKEIALGAKKVALGHKEVAHGDPIKPVPPLSTSSLTSGPVADGSVEGSPAAPDQDQDFSGDDGRLRSASRARTAPPDLAYTIVRHFPREVGAELHGIVETMLRDGTGRRHIEAALAAWQASHKPPEALPEFVEPPP